MGEIISISLDTSALKIFICFSQISIKKTLSTRWIRMTGMIKRCWHGNSMRFMKKKEDGAGLYRQMMDGLNSQSDLWTVHTDNKLCNSINSLAKVLHITDSGSLAWRQMIDGLSFRVHLVEQSSNEEMI